MLITLILRNIRDRGERRKLKLNEESKSQIRNQNYRNQKQESKPEKNQKKRDTTGAPNRNIKKIIFLEVNKMNKK